ncbi:MAG: nucleotidyltransferase domain-containing protein [Candidatus Ranarchaeia archaeon]
MAIQINELGLPYTEEIDAFVRKAIKVLSPKLIVLFGSMARDSYGAASDVDIMVVSDRLTHNYNDRLEVLSLLNETFAPIEVVGYTTDELERLIRNARGLVLNALSEGKVLYYEANYLARVQQLLEETFKRWGLKKKDNAWIKTKMSQL